MFVSFMWHIIKLHRTDSMHVLVKQDTAVPRVNLRLGPR